MKKLQYPNFIEVKNKNCIKGSIITNLIDLESHIYYQKFNYTKKYKTTLSHACKAYNLEAPSYLLRKSYAN